MKPKKITLETKIDIRLNEREYKLITEHTFVETEHIESIREVPGKSYYIASYTIEDLEDVLGFIAAEANHAENKQLERELDNLYDRLSTIEASYDVFDV